MEKITILIIGPMGAGKSSVALALSKRLGIRNVSMDKLQHYYYYKYGYSNLEAQAAESREGFKGYIDYCKQFHLQFIQEAVETFEGSIIDFGGNHTYFDEEQTNQAVYESLKKQKNVILLLPSENMETNVQVLNSRLKKRFAKKPQRYESFAIENIKFLKDPLIYDIANYVFFTLDKELDDLIDEIVEICVFL
jgi:shikimate kinase